MTPVCTAVTPQQLFYILATEKLSNQLLYNRYSNCDLPVVKSCHELDLVMDVIMSDQV